MARLIDRDEHEHDHMVALRDIDVEAIVKVLNRMRVSPVMIEDHMGLDGPPILAMSTRPVLAPHEAEAFKTFIDSVRAADEARRRGGG